MRFLLNEFANVCEFILLMYAEAIGWKGKQEDVYRVHPEWRLEQ